MMTVRENELEVEVERWRKRATEAEAVIAKAHHLLYGDGDRVGLYVRLCNLIDDAYYPPAAAQAAE